MKKALPWSAVVLLFVLVGGPACGPKGGTQPERALNVGLINRDLVMLARHADVDTAEARSLIKAGYYTAVFSEYNDEQEFLVVDAATHAVSYGTLAHAFAWTETEYTNGQFQQAWQNVGIVDLDAQDNSAPYAALKLLYPRSCLYLNRQGNTWSAGLQAPQAGTCQQALSAAPTYTLLATEDSKSTDMSKDYPNVIRFLEGTTPGTTYIGVKCDNRWCIIGTDDKTKVAAPIYPQTSTKKKVRGWHDQQTVAMLQGNTLVSTTTAAVTADDNLSVTDTVAFKKDYLNAATVYIPTLAQGATQPMLDAYKKKYGFTPGSNTIQIQLFDGVAGGEAMITAGDGSVHYRHVTRTDHHQYGLTKINGTVVWRWKALDEEIWVGCDVGCCLVEAGDS